MDNKWNNNKLEPVLITYNRAEDLLRTLDAFIAADLTWMKLHVLDNASTDNTKLVVNAVQKKWPNLTYHRNLYNIGGNANILRAVEITSSEYSWIIGDDDAWHLNDISDLCAALRDGDADIIRLGWLVSKQSRGLKEYAVDLASKESLLFASISMISATIVRRSIIIPHLPHAYMGACDAYPQLVPLIRAISRIPLIIYTLKHDLMTHTPSNAPGYYFGDLEWASSWFRISRFIESSELRKLFLGEVMIYMSRKHPGKLNEFIRLVKKALNFKSLSVNQWPYLLSMMAYGTGYRLRMFWLMVIYALLPMKIAVLLRRFYMVIKNKNDSKLKCDRSRL